MLTFVRRAFNSNLSSVSASESEGATLDAAGIHETTAQRYLVWRRSLVVVVVMATILGAGIGTLRDLNEPEDAATVFDTIFENALAESESRLPSASILTADDLEENEIANSEAVQTAVSGTQDDSTPKEDDEPQTAFGQFADAVHLLSLYALPLAALAVAICWTRHRLSFRILQVGFAFSFFVPMLIALCPWSWWGYEEAELTPGAPSAEHFQAMTEGALEGIGYLVALLPTVLSLIPGVQRASLRIKTLLPQSLLPGWFLIAAAPFYALFLLVVFVAINQIASDPLFLVGMFLFLAAPLVYVVRGDLFTAPLLTHDDYQRMRRVQRTVGLITLLAGAMLAVWVSTQNVMGIRMLGFNPETSLLRPLDLIEFVVELVGRSMFMTVLGADVLLWMNLKAWKHHRQLVCTPAAESYDQAMESLATCA